MKKNMKFKLILFVILSIIVICLFIFFNKDEVNNPSENPNIDNPSDNPNIDNPDEEDTPDEVGTSYLNDIKYTVKVDQEVEDVIVEFLNVYYNAIKELKENDMTYLFKDSKERVSNLVGYAISVFIFTFYNFVSMFVNFSSSS